MDFHRRRRRLGQVALAAILSLGLGVALAVSEMSTRRLVNWIPTEALLTYCAVVATPSSEFRELCVQELGTRKISVAQFDRLAKVCCQDITALSNSNKVDLLAMLTEMVVDDDGRVSRQRFPLEVIDYWRPWKGDVWHEESYTSSKDTVFRSALKQSAQGKWIATQLWSYSSRCDCATLALLLRAIMATGQYSTVVASDVLEIIERCRYSHSRLEAFRLLVAMGPAAESVVADVVADKTKNRELREDSALILQVMRSE